jgi:tryptophan-rich hypothetical protein
MNPSINLNPKKLLLSKWTAVQVLAKQKHFIVTRLILPEDDRMPIVEVEIEAVYSGKKHCLPWRQLQDQTRWRQGWL